MDGNHSLLDVAAHLIHSADFKASLIINIVLGLPANMCVIWLILAMPGDKAGEIFYFNQAVCEVIICIANVAMLIALNTTGSNVANVILLYYTFRLSNGLLFTGRPMFMSCVCFERYLAVVRPVTFLKYKLLRYRLAASIISWISVLGSCIIIVCVPNPDIYFVCFCIAVTWFLVEIFCCVETLRALVRHGPGEGKQESNGLNSAKLKAFRIISIIFVGATVCYLPYIFLMTLFNRISEEHSSRLFYIAIYTALVSGFIPPFLYIHRAGKLQLCFKDPI